MGLNRAFDRPFFTIGGQVKTSGGSMNLAKGQLALVDLESTTPTGVQVLSTLQGQPKKEKRFALRLGIEDKEVNRSRNNKPQSTMPFSLDEIVGLSVNTPQITKHIVDDFVLGYDGFDPDTSFKFNRGDSYFRLSLEIKGGALEYRGGDGITEIPSVNVEVPECDPFNACDDCDDCESVDCRKVVTEAIERLRRRELTGNIKVEEVVDITPVFSCREDRSEIPYDYYTLDVCDTGTDEAKALVEAQYDVPVIRIDRKGSTSTYQLLIPQASGAPDDYTQTIASIIKGCEDCPAGFSEVPGGVLYAFTIEDDGVDLSATFDGLPNAVAASTIKSGNSAGVGFYTTLFTQELTSGQITTFLGAGAPNNTATVDLIGTVDSLCEDGTVTSISWEVGDTCNVAEDTYSIVLPDNECGEDRLEEIQGAYPNNSISIALTGETQQDLTLTGTSGTATITIGGNTYTATFNSDLTTTADDFVTAEAANILAADGLVVTADSGVLSFVGDTTGYPAISIANATGDLDGTVAAAVALEDRRACQTKYTTTVVTNIVCEECDPVFKDFYTSHAPQSFQNRKWHKDTTSSGEDGTCLCGIRFRAKEFVLAGEEALRDRIGFTETSAQIRGAAGYPEEIREGIGRLPKGAYEAYYFSEQQHRTHLAGNLRDLEDEGRSYFRDLDRGQDYLERLLQGTTSNLEDQFKQYVHYVLTVNHSKHTQGFASRQNEDINYDIFVEVGRHNAVENLLNDIAANAGVETVQAFGV